VTDRRRGGTAEERDETARAIVAAARRLFMAHGYRAVSTRQVAEAVGLTQPALYHHFATKEELYVAVALHEVGRLRAGIERLAGRDGPWSARLHDIARFMLTTVDYDFPLMYHDMGTELGTAARERLGAAFYGGIIGPLAALFAEGEGAGLVRGEAQGGLGAAGGAGLFMALVAHFLDRPAAGGPARGARTSGDATATLLMGVLLQGVGVSREQSAVGSRQSAEAEEEGGSGGGL
jgi:AcrR family transcriptional regulator